jgi:hypothetical protein
MTSKTRLSRYSRGVAAFHFGASRGHGSASFMVHPPSCVFLRRPRSHDRIKAIASLQWIATKLREARGGRNDRALRDEGTSYHYLPPSEFAEADPELVAAADVTLNDGPRVVVGSTLTTNAPFPCDRRGDRSCTKHRNSCSRDGSSGTLRICMFGRRTPSLSRACHQHHGSGWRERGTPTTREALAVLDSVVAALHPAD